MNAKRGRREMGLKAGLVCGLFLISLWGIGLPTGSALRCPSTLMGPEDYPGTDFTCKAKHFSTGRDSYRYIVIHTIEGSLQSGIYTFATGSRPVSAHYLVGRDGTVVQMVRERDTAWHAGTCSLGSDPRRCEGPRSYVINANSIGIEHQGSAHDPDFDTEAMYKASAALARSLADKYGIPVDRAHIVGHEEIKPTKGDPGPHWDWEHYMRLIKGEPDARPAPSPERPASVAPPSRTPASSTAATSTPSPPQTKPAAPSTPQVHPALVTLFVLGMISVPVALMLSLY